MLSSCCPGKAESRVACEYPDLARQSFEHRTAIRDFKHSLPLRLVQTTFDPDLTLKGVEHSRIALAVIAIDRQCIAFALGADACYTARGFMFALGWIQARECGNNTCPVGITTQDPRLQAGLVPAAKAVRVKNYVDNTCHELEEFTIAMGKVCPSELTIDDLYIPTGSNLWRMFADRQGLRETLKR